MLAPTAATSSSLVSRLPLPLWLLAASVLCAAVQRAMASSRAAKPFRLTSADETICVILVGTEATALRALAAAFRSSAATPSAVDVAIVVVVQSAAQVARETAAAAARRESDSSITLTYMYSAKPRHALNEARKEAMLRLFNNERYVLFAHGCRPLHGWDAILTLGLRHHGHGPHGGPRGARGTILTAFPGPSGGDESVAAPRALFPRLRLDTAGSVHVHTAPMAVAEPTAFLASTVWSRAFTFCDRETCRVAFGSGDNAWCDGQLEQTVALAQRGVRILLPAAPICVRASRMGVGAPPSSGSVAIDNPAFGAFPLAGLVSRTDTAEAIFKYGSVDVARVFVRQQQQRGAQEGG